MKQEDASHDASDETTALVTWLGYQGSSLSLPETNVWHLKMEGWLDESVSLWDGLASWQVLLLLVFFLEGNHDARRKLSEANAKGDIGSKR